MSTTVPTVAGGRRLHPRPIHRRSARTSGGAHHEFDDEPGGFRVRLRMEFLALTGRNRSPSTAGTSPANAAIWIEDDASPPQVEDVVDGEDAARAAKSASFNAAARAARSVFTGSGGTRYGRPRRRAPD